MNIDAINASNNSIVRISHLAHLGGTLNTLGLAHNKLVSPDDVRHLLEVSPSSLYPVCICDRTHFSLPPWMHITSLPRPVRTGRTSLSPPPPAPSLPLPRTLCPACLETHVHALPCLPRLKEARHCVVPLQDVGMKDVVLRCAALPASPPQR